MDSISNKGKEDRLPGSHAGSVPASWALLYLQTKGQSASVPAGISQSTSASCQQPQFRKRSPHPSVSLPENLSAFSLQYSQILHLPCAGSVLPEWILDCSVKVYSGKLLGNVVLAWPRGDKRNCKTLFSSSTVAVTTKAAARGLLALVPTHEWGKSPATL